MEDISEFRGPVSGFRVYSVTGKGYEEVYGQDTKTPVVAAGIRAILDQGLERLELFSPGRELKVGADSRGSFREFRTEYPITLDSLVCDKKESDDLADFLYRSTAREGLSKSAGLIFKKGDLKRQVLPFYQVLQRPTEATIELPGYKSGASAETFLEMMQGRYGSGVRNRLKSKMHFAYRRKRVLQVLFS